MTALVDRLAAAPSPIDAKRAGARLGDLLERAERQAPELVVLLREGPLRELMLAVADHSPHLWHLAYGRPARLARIATMAPDDLHRAIVSEQGSRHRAAMAGASRDELMRALRVARGDHALLVGLADIGGVWDVDRVTGALSDFADASVRSALAIALHEAAGLGRITLADPDDPGPGCGVVILALGKHGAGELNYSSDIDLVVFFDPAASALSANVEAPTFYARIAQTVARLLQERTPDGYVHRVDYRLRPDPGSTAVAVSLPAAYSYYETVGQNWERAALIKARPVAGDLDLGQRFLADLSPFIWRKYFDFAAIADVHAMKRQIHAVRGHDRIAVAGHDIKLGRGGIREIEFFVQTQQLVFGGRRPALRGRRTLDMLAELHEEGWITAEARDELTVAYRYLRGIEHRLQMVADEQTQRLPHDEAHLKAFARFCGYPSTAGFAKALTRQAGVVQKHYALLFEEAGELASEAGNLVFTGAGDDPETLATLRRLGFKDPERVAETVRGWHFGRRAAVTSARAREVLTELVPGLLTALGGTADPDHALAALDTAFSRMPAAVELMTILLNHERLLLLFADLLGTAPRLADTVAVTPHVLDAVIDPDFVDPVVDEAPMEAQIRGAIGRPASFEEFLDRARDAARQARFVTGARMLSGILAPARAGLSYAATAQAIVRVSLEAVEAAFAAEHGRVPGGRMAVLGLGRLGTRELTAGSDLDLVVLYDFDPDDRTSSGARPLDAAVYYSRLTQRLVSALTVPSRRGRLYEVDLRLRPAGNKGPIAAQFRGFLAYQREEAELWEHMALTRARTIAGDADLRAAVEAAIAETLALPRDPAFVAREAYAMRALIAREKGEGHALDLKLAPGGLTDLDFIAQTLVLSHAARHPGLVGLPPGEVFAAASAAGLLADRDAATLAEAHALMTGVFHWQRLTIEGAFDPKTVPPAILRRIAAEANLPDPKRLQRHLDDTRRAVRQIFDRLLG
ncbi:bifunctional [glutamine synthetase] adenylyltransferase/[glutamine synthetase]-adenylyl-L-tyrosine phosphorylase [Salinarimonas soli]|uniref:Bifunctional glutamine synthetase adenylyltransferase/adenylyl-removing enzyme n=1 Tax=Salinarimonas soli TaxID=1638099 RepID=A0A5B2VCU2_9HYPH|nr:bifunctional [glutamine synthetase] adenylyltransferase/[glutamine synthetase]-adenylyl-L-tyrosine phosphorylase [Salinarimonas soli]KAA2236129.1 bifunctional [glutamine synthetase] adenylyltransferase/[glutamine synthetase]-adenylyl-L-tyrosine phosphorylase [Salinarimonas soli]